MMGFWSRSRGPARSKSVLSIAALAIVLDLSGIEVSHAGASRDLWGRSVLMSWTETAQVHRERRNPGKSGYFEKSQAGQATVYISERGRLFGEAGLRGRRNENVSDQTPDQAEDDGVNVGSPWHWQALGTRLVATRIFSQGAVRVEANVRPDGTCQLNVLYGKEGGAIIRTGRRRAPEEVLSEETHDQACRVVQGNALAQ